MVWARFRVRGKMAHGAMPEAGINPISCLGVILREAPALERRLRRVCERSRHLRPPTVTPTVIQGPARGVGVPQSNVIPAVAELVLDVRLTPGIDADGIRTELEAVCRKAEGAYPGVKVEWEADQLLPARHPGRQVRGAGAGDDRRREGGRRPGAAIRRGARLDGRHDSANGARNSRSSRVDRATG